MVITPLNLFHIIVTNKIQTDCKSILLNHIHSLRLHQSCLYADSSVFHFEHFYLYNLLACLFSAEHHYFQEVFRSENWLGKFSPIPKINGGKLWLSLYLNSTGLTNNDKTHLLKMITKG